MTRPRVTAEHAINPGTRALDDPEGPKVAVVVDFAYGDHDPVLAALDRAVANVRAQIEETR